METMIDRYARDIQFAAALAEQNREMEQYINECLIKASGNKRAIQEMTILNESSFGDKIKGFFQKIKDFFKKIFDKFGAAMSSLFGEQKEYINKYSNIITKCKYVATDVEGVKDHFKGLPRILSVAENVDTAIIGSNMDKYFADDKVPSTEGEITRSEQYPYDNATKLLEIVKDKLPEKIDLDKVRDRAFTEFIQIGYWSGMSDFSKETKDDGTVDVDGSFRVYFDGSKDDVSWSTDQIDDNFQTVINTTYAGQSYLKKLEKINERINARMDDASKKMTEYYEAQKKKIQEGIDVGKDAKDNNLAQAKAPDIKELSDGKAEYNGVVYADKTAAQAAKTKDETENKAMKPTQVQTNSANITGSSYYLEINGVADSKTSSTQSKVNTATGSSNVEKAGKGLETADKLKANTPQAKDSATSGVDATNKENVLKAANSLLDIDIYNRQARVNADVQISSSIARNLYGAFQQLNKDFYWIIQKHVQWYLSNPGEESKTENQRAKVSSLDMNAGNQSVSTKAPVTVKPAGAQGSPAASNPAASNKAASNKAQGDLKNFNNNNPNNNSNKK